MHLDHLIYVYEVTYMHVYKYRYYNSYTKVFLVYAICMSDCSDGEAITICQEQIPTVSLKIVSL